MEDFKTLDIDISDGLYEQLEKMMEESNKNSGTNYQSVDELASKLVEDYVRKEKSKVRMLNEEG